MPSKSSTRPVISVITICLNAAKELPLTIESVIGQSYRPVEFIVLDGMSWDDTAGVLDRYRDAISTIDTIEDNGIYYAMNAATDLASGEYVLFLTAGDSFYDADAIDRAVSAVRDEPDIFFGNHICVNDRLELFRRSADFGWLLHQLSTKGVSTTWMERIPCHQATFTRRSLLRDLRYDTQLRVGADHDLLFRAHAAGARLQYIDEVVAHYHGGYSQTMGVRTTLENLAIYHGHGSASADTDRCSLPDDRPSSAEHARDGIGAPPMQQRIDGQDGLQLSRGIDRVGSGQDSHWGVELCGATTAPGRTLSLLADEEVIGSARLPLGEFRVRSWFARMLEPESDLAIRAEAPSPGDVDDLTITGFRLLSPTAHRAWQPSRASDTIEFTSSLSNNLSDILDGGWSSPEPDHLWSLGTCSCLWLYADRTVSRLRINLSGNPHVPDGQQKVQLLVNDVAALHCEFVHGARLALELSTDHPGWLAGQANRLTFKPDSAAMPPAQTHDKRMLGICLWSIDFL